MSLTAGLDVVNDTVKRLRLEYGNNGRKNVSATTRTGLFGNLVGAEVAADQHIEVGKNGEHVSIRHTLLVTCTGFGCAEPLGTISTRDLIFDCDHGDVTEGNRLAACQRAQEHAERCRAMPRP